MDKYQESYNTLQNTINKYSFIHLIIIVSFYLTLTVINKDIISIVNYEALLSGMFFYFVSEAELQERYKLFRNRSPFCLYFPVLCLSLIQQMAT